MSLTVKEIVKNAREVWMPGWTMRLREWRTERRLKKYYRKPIVKMFIAQRKVYQDFMDEK